MPSAARERFSARRSNTRESWRRATALGPQGWIALERGAGGDHVASNHAPRRRQASRSGWSLKDKAFDHLGARVFPRRWLRRLVAAQARGRRGFNAGRRFATDILILSALTIMAVGIVWVAMGMATHKEVVMMLPAGAGMHVVPRAQDFTG